MTIANEVQLLAPSAKVDLFDLDLSTIGTSSVERFHCGTNQLKSNVVWQGHTYYAVVARAEGFAKSARGPTARPKFVIANLDGAFGNLLAQYDDLIGAKLIRRRTYLKYLDAVNFPGGTNPTADPTAEVLEVWYVERKVSEKKLFVEMELAPPWDVQGISLPRRSIVELCTWIYRRWNGSSFDYTKATCPYTGASYFTTTDQSTTAANDVCGKRISSCKARFGAYAELPFGGFPGAGQIR